MRRTRNVLFVMSDQLRYDYLSCMGHPSLATPHIDALAARGVLFTHAYCNAPVCGPSRDVVLHRALRVLARRDLQQLPAAGRRVDARRLHAAARTQDRRGRQDAHAGEPRRGCAGSGSTPASTRGILIGECGFEPFERDDGLHPDEALDPDLRYNRYLRGLGYDSPNPWHDFANSAEGGDGSVLSGWQMRHASRPARVAEEHSETAYMTDRAMAFIEGAGGEPWCLHLSYHQAALALCGARALPTACSVPTP